MKRLVFLLSILILGISCQKESLLNGTYTANTVDGTICIELQGKNKCITYFQGGDKPDEGTYHISNGEIDLMTHASITIAGKTRSWWFGGDLGKGTISGSCFTIQAQRVWNVDIERLNITFRKQ
jgi:hypothetical protein